MKSQVQDLRDRQADIEKRFDKVGETYVPFKHFDAVCNQIAGSLKTIQMDLRGIREMLFDRKDSSNL